MPALLRYLPLLMAGILALALAFRLLQMGQPEQDYSSYHDPMLGQPVPPLVLAPLLEAGEPLELAALEGQPYLLNVFASWCAACQMEHGDLKHLAEKTALPLYGMAWKDEPLKTRAWLQRMGNIYTHIGTDVDGKAGVELGLTGAPETYFIGADGHIHALYRGAISESVINTRFLPAIAAQAERQP